jgi:hypothetical protein
MVTGDYLSRSHLLLEYLIAIGSEGSDTEDPKGPNPETGEHDLQET